MFIGNIEILVVFGTRVLYMHSIVHAVADTLSQDPTTCTIDRVANMYHNEGDGPSIFSTPLFPIASHGWSKLRYLNTA